MLDIIIVTLLFAASLNLCRQGSLQDFTFWGGGVEGLWGGGSRLGVGGLRVIKNKVSNNFGGGVTDFFFVGGGGSLPLKTGLQETLVG